MTSAPTRPRPWVILLGGLLVLLDIMSYGALIPLLPAARDLYGMSESVVGLLVGTVAYGTLLASLPAGALVARFGPRRTTLTGAAISGGLYVGFWLSTTIPMMLITRTLLGVATSFVWVGSPVWASTGHPNRARIMGIVTGTGMLGSVLGPTVGAWLSSPSDPFRAFLWIGIALLTLAAIGWASTRRLGAYEMSERVSLRDTTGVWRDRRFIAGAALVMYGAVLAGSESILLALGLGDRGMSEHAIGVLFSIAGIGLALSQMNPHWLAGRRSAGVRTLVAVALGALILAVPLAFPTVIGFGIATVLITVPMGLSYGTSLGLLADGAEASGTHASVGAAYWSILWAAVAGIAPPLYGASLERVGEQRTLLAAIVVIVLIGVSVWRYDAARLRSAAPEEPHEEDAI